MTLAKLAKDAKGSGFAGTGVKKNIAATRLDAWGNRMALRANRK